MPDVESDNHSESRQERRERKLRKKQERTTQHGKSLVKIYHNAIMKRLKKK
jgi:hypothetical protein